MTSIYLACIFRSFAGITSICIAIIFNSLFQVNIEKKDQGKVFSLLEISDNIFTIGSICLFGFISRYTDENILLTISGAIMIVYSVIISIANSAFNKSAETRRIENAS